MLVADPTKYAARPQDKVNLKLGLHWIFEGKSLKIR